MQVFSTLGDIKLVVLNSTGTIQSVSVDIKPDEEQFLLDQAELIKNNPNQVLN